MTPQELVLELQDDCTSVARGVARNFDGTVDWEDVRQELFVYILTSGKGLNPENRPGCRKILGRAAEVFCQKERAKALHVSPQYHYTRDRARYLLDQHFAGNDDFKPVDDAGIENQSLGQLDELMDLKAGLDVVSLVDFQRIADVHTGAVKHENSSAGQRAYNRAVEKLLRKMNSYFYQREREYSGPGARDVITTAAATAVIRSDYSGEGEQAWRMDGRQSAF